MKKLIFILSSTVLLNACVATTPTAPLDLSAPIATDKARIVVERDNSNLYFAAQVKVISNDTEIASLSRGHSVMHSVTTGPNKLSVKAPMTFGSFTVNFNAQAGQTYKFIVSPRGNNLMGAYGFGLLGDAIHAKVSEEAGYFKLQPTN